MTATPTTTPSTFYHQHQRQQRQLSFLGFTFFFRGILSKICVGFPFLKENEYFDCVKVGKRKVDAQAIISTGMRVAIAEDKTVSNITLVFGAVGTTAGQTYVTPTRSVVHWIEII